MASAALAAIGTSAPMDTPTPWESAAVRCKLVNALVIALLCFHKSSYILICLFVECGEDVGGRNHQLSQRNRVARDFLTDIGARDQLPPQ